MKREKVYLIDLSSHGYRCGKPAEVIGIEMCAPNGSEPRLCYHLRWEDLKEDWKPVRGGIYQIKTFSELLVGDYGTI